MQEVINHGGCEKYGERGDQIGLAEFDAQNRTEEQICLG